MLTDSQRLAIRRSSLGRLSQPASVTPVRRLTADERRSDVAQERAEHLTMMAERMAV